jgi:hypothetical protein
MHDVGFEAFTAVDTNVDIFWVIVPWVSMRIGVSEENIASIFRVEYQPSKKPACGKSVLQKRREYKYRFITSDPMKGV